MSMHHNFNIHELKLREGEHLISVMRKHWFVLFIKLLPLKIFILLPLIIMILAPATSSNIPFVANTVFFSAAMILMTMMLIFTIWTTYYLDIWIVTNQRIMDIEQRGIFKREIKTLRMETVQDVQTNQTGILEEFLNFGTLRVQTAGTGGTDGKIVGIPMPAAERNLIMNQVQLINQKTRGTYKAVANSGNKKHTPHVT